MQESINLLYSLNDKANIDDIEFCALSDKDVVRHPLVQAIVKAYERDDRRKAEKENDRHSKQSK